MCACISSEDSSQCWKKERSYKGRNGRARRLASSIFHIIWCKDNTRKGKGRERGGHRECIHTHGYFEKGVDWLILRE